MADELNSADSPNNAATSRARKITIAVAVVVLLIAVAVVLKVATGGDSTTSTTTLPPSTESTLPAASQKAIADYRAFWDAYLKASNPMRPDSPDLAAHATGEQYRQVVESFSAMKAGNEIIKGDLDLAPKVVEQRDTEATVVDCIDDRTGIYDATSGERKDTDDPRRRQSRATLQLVDGTWKLSHLTSEGFGCTP